MGCDKVTHLVYIILFIYNTACFVFILIYNKTRPTLLESYQIDCESIKWHSLSSHVYCNFKVRS